MAKSACSVCCSKKTVLTCTACEQSCCKYCAVTVDSLNCEFIEYLPEKVIDKIFCPYCYDAKVAELVESHKATLERAKEVNVYSKIQSSETRLIRRIEDPIKVEDCDDRKQALLRLAFLAAQKGYDTVVDVDLKSHKVYNGSYKKQIWRGTAVPVDSEIRN